MAIKYAKMANAYSGHETLHLPEIPKWHLEEIAKESDSSDREILAYQFGKKDGKKEEQENFFKKFATNMQISCFFTESFFDFIEDKLKIVCEYTCIKPISSSIFQVIFVINFNDYKNRDLREKIYAKAYEISLTLKEKDIQLEYLFMTSNNFDKSDLLNDGYLWAFLGDEEKK